MNLSFTKHAKHVMSAREIKERWILETVKNPEFREEDPHDAEIERFYRRVAERDNRVLRFAVNTKLATWRVVSVFFDRKMRGKL